MWFWLIIKNYTDYLIFFWPSSVAIKTLIKVSYLISTIILEIKIFQTVYKQKTKTIFAYCILESLLLFVWIIQINHHKTALYFYELVLAFFLLTTINTIWSFVFLYSAQICINNINKNNLSIMIFVFCEFLKYYTICFHFFLPLSQNIGYPHGNPIIPLFFLDNHPKKRIFTKDFQLIHFAPNKNKKNLILGLTTEIKKIKNKKMPTIIISPEAFWEEAFCYSDKLENMLTKIIKNKNINLILGAYKNIGNDLYQASCHITKKKIGWYFKQFLCPLYERRFFKSCEEEQKNFILIHNQKKIIFQPLLCSEFFLLRKSMFKKSDYLLLQTKLGYLPQVFRKKLLAFARMISWVKKIKIIWIDEDGLHLINN